MKRVKAGTVTRSACIKGVIEVRWDRQGAANAFDSPLVEELSSQLDAAGNDPSVRVLVLRGVGNVYSGGFDLSGTLRDDELVCRFSRVDHLLCSIRRFPAVTVAAVRGPAYGMGADIVVSCDYRVGDFDARFRFPGVQFGVVLGTRLLAARVGASRALDWLLRNEVVGVEEASKCGLLTDVVRADEHDAFIARISASVSGMDRTTVLQLLSVLRPDMDDSATSDLTRSVLRKDLANRVTGYRDGVIFDA